MHGKDSNEKREYPVRKKSALNSESIGLKPVAAKRSFLAKQGKESTIQTIESRKHNARSNVKTTALKAERRQEPETEKEKDMETRKRNEKDNALMKTSSVSENGGRKRAREQDEEERASKRRKRQEVQRQLVKRRKARQMEQNKLRQKVKTSSRQLEQTSPRQLEQNKQRRKNLTPTVRGHICEENRRPHRKRRREEMGREEMGREEEETQEPRQKRQKKDTLGIGGECATGVTRRTRSKAISRDFNDNHETDKNGFEALDVKCDLFRERKRSTTTIV